MNQLENEREDVVAVIDYLADGPGNSASLRSTLIEGDQAGMLALFSSVADYLSDLNAPTGTKMNPDVGNILNMVGAIVSMGAAITSPELAPVLGVASGALWAAGSAGLADVNGNGIPAPTTPY